MAEQVQAILERMVPYLKDLRNRNLFNRDEIRLIVERRRKSEYLLQRRSQAQMSDYLRYIEDELRLERLRKLRKEKVLTELKVQTMTMPTMMTDGKHPAASYQTSGPGDAHIISHIHFLYQRTLKKFHYPLEVLLNYAEFSKEVKSFHMLSRIYAMGMQHHPREVGLWIEAASFEYFGYVAQDYESRDYTSREKQHSRNRTLEEEQEGDSKGINSKVVGSSIKNARVLMQRGLRINRSSTELWLQYFALELHYVQKIRGRKQILEKLKTTETHLSGIDNGNEYSKEESNTSLLPCQVIFKNAILAIPNDIHFRLRFIETCQMFPDTSILETIVMTSIITDFGSSVDGWLAQISYAEEQLKKMNKNTMDTNKKEEMFSDEIFDGKAEKTNDEYNNCQPSKRARFSNESRKDTALCVLQKALETLPNSKLYLEGARFLHTRIRHLLEHNMRSDFSDNEASIIDDDNDDDDDVSYLLEKDEDINKALHRHFRLFDQLYESADKKNASSTALTLDYVDFLMNTEKSVKAEQLLSNTITANPNNVDVRLWLRWADIVRQSSSSTLSPTQILRRALKYTPIHNRNGYMLILTELMKELMTLPPSQKLGDELQSLFQKLIVLSQGLSTLTISTKDKDKEDGVIIDGGMGRSVNVASVSFAFFNYALLNKESSNIFGDDSIRSIYTSLLYHSSYGKSCHGKSQDELLDMQSFFDACIRYEKLNRHYRSTSSSVGGGTKRDTRKDSKKNQKMNLIKLYTTAINFFSSGGGCIVSRDTVTRFQQDLDHLKCSL